MSDPEIWPRWLDLDNQSQVVWAVEYLKNKGHINICSETSDEVLASFVIANYNNHSYSELFGKMRKAWNQKAYMANMKGRKQYNFILNRETRGKIRSESKRLEISESEFLDKVVSDFDSLRKELNKKNKQDKENQRKSLERMYNRPPVGRSLGEHEKEKFLQLQDEIEKLKDDHDDLLMKYLRVKELCDANKLDEGDLNVDQICNIQENFKAMAKLWPKD